MEQCDKRWLGSSQKQKFQLCYFLSGKFLLSLLIFNRKMGMIISNTDLFYFQLKAVLPTLNNSIVDNI